MPDIEIRMPADEKEGTAASVGKWLRKRGEAVRENEPLVEINTDKVTLEIAAPASGTLADMLKQEGDEVLPGDLLGRIRSGEVAGVPAAASGGAAAPQAKTPVAVKAGADRESFSPAVRRLLREHNVDPALVPKVSGGGRLTIQDIEAFLASGGTRSVTAQTAKSGTRGRMVSHTPMRKSIARHMAQSVQTAPHVTSVFEADLSRVVADREARKSGSPDDVPSVTAYLIEAALKAIKAVPQVNSKWHDDALEIFDEVNFGFGTALEGGGLVVPVIRDAQTLALDEISRQLRELTAKARAGKLTNSDMEAGTFTLSNHGVSGSLVAAPIILPHGQAAILGVGKMQRRVVVCEGSGGRELFRIRPMMYVTLTVDHRVLDAQQTNAWLTAFVAALESGD